MRIGELCEDFLLITDSCQVAETQDFLGLDIQGCDSLFVRLDADGSDYDTVYGFEGIVPRLDKRLVLLYGNPSGGR